MKKLKVFIPVSLDGYIAPLYGGFDLLENYPLTEGEDWGKKEFFDSVDTVIMGGNTYREFIGMTILPFKDKEVYVVSTTQLRLPEQVHFITENPIEKIIELKNQTGKDIYVFGGGILISSLLEKNLIDSMIINHVPIMLGNGIPLFPKFSGETQWELTNSHSFKNGILRAEYQLIR